MKHLHDKVNIVPVIAKADTLTAPEIKRLKEKVRMKWYTEQEICCVDCIQHIKTTTWQSLSAKYDLLNPCIKTTHIYAIRPF